MTDSHALFGWSPLVVASTIFILCYALIIVEWVNRAIVALLGAAVVIALGVLTEEQAIQGIDFDTLGLLIGMMLFVAVMGQSGLFRFLAIKGAKMAGARPWGILVTLSVITGVLSAFLNNVTVVMLVAPVTLLIADELNLDPYPFLFAEINASNIGGTATLIGDPPNMMIGSAAGLTFNQFLAHLAPLTVVVFAATVGPLWVLYGRRMRVAPEARARLLALNEREAITDRRLLVGSLVVYGLMILGFAWDQPGLPPATIAMAGAALLLVLATFHMDPEKSGQRVHDFFTQVEWVTVFFILGLFVVVAGMERAGLLKIFAQRTLALTGGDFAVTTMAILWVSAILSAIVDNIPFVAAMIPIIKDLLPEFEAAGIPPAQLAGLWWALAAGACLGGNGTLVGASANLVVAGIAERHGVAFRFLPFLRVAFPLMLLQIAITAIYVWWRYL